MPKLKLDIESLMVVTFATDPAPETVFAAAVVSEMTDRTCKPYLCINWPTS